MSRNSRSRPPTGSSPRPRPGSRKSFSATPRNRSRFRSIFLQITEELALSEEIAQEELNRTAIRILDICNRIGGSLDPEECNGEAWLAYCEACSTYPSFADHCDWDSYLTIHLEAAIDTLRKRRNQTYSLESPFSLDQTVGGSQTPVIQWLHLPQGDFTRGVDLRDYLSRLSQPERELAGRFVRADTDLEIRSDWQMPPEIYYHLKRTLRANMQSYLEL